MLIQFSNWNYIDVYTFLSPVLVSYSSLWLEISFRVRSENRNMSIGVLVCVRRCVMLCETSVSVCKNASGDKWTMWKEASFACDWMESGTESFLVKMRFTSIIGHNMPNSRQAS
jgi:hypothetical protein